MSLALQLLLTEHSDWLEQEASERSLHEFIRQFWREMGEYGEFKDNWHIDAICEHLEAVTNGGLNRLIINVPPRHMKSLSVSVAWPAWMWIHYPFTRFLFSSHTGDLSQRDTRKSRLLMESPKYQRRWGHLFKFRTKAVTRYENTEGGYRMATSVGGSLTGHGGDVIVVDDAHNVQVTESDTERENVLRWWDEAMSTRLNDPVKGAYVIIMQRIHYKDLVGHLLGRGDWTHLCLPARYESDHPHVWANDPRTSEGELLWPNHYGEAALREREENLGSYGSAGQLQQRPAPRSGGMFDRDKWGWADAAPAGGRVVRGWDLAGTMEQPASWSVGCRMKLLDGVFYIEDVSRFRDTPLGVEKRMKSIAGRDGADVLIDIPQDPGQAGKAQVQYLVKQLAGYNVRYSLESGSKEGRAEPLSAQQEAGNVVLIRGDWNDKFVDEMTLFPNAEFSDQADAASRAFHRLLRGEKRIGIEPPEVVNLGG